jgi:hypothetical protein
MPSPKPDGRNLRKAQTRTKISQAISRLSNGTAVHPLHIGVRVRVTKEAVAREAGVSNATIYRFPDLCTSIAALSATKNQRIRPSEQRRKALHDRIADLERMLNGALSETVRLTRELVKYDPSLGVKTPISLEQRRRKKNNGTVILKRSTQ